MSQYRCKECRSILHTREILVNKNPFDEDEDIEGCPMCSSINCFEIICDEAGCTKVSTHGWPSGNRYRHTCYEHYSIESEK